MDENTMSKKDFLALRHRQWDEEIVCDCLVVIPGDGRKLHDSGYRCMDFVGIDRENDSMCLLSGCSDVIHIEGIGGFGADWRLGNSELPTTVPPVAWSVDCLAKTGFLRFFIHNHKIKCGPALSSFEIFSEKIPERQA